MTRSMNHNQSLNSFREVEVNQTRKLVLFHKVPERRVTSWHHCACCYRWEHCGYPSASPSWLLPVLAEQDIPTLAVFSWVSALQLTCKALSTHPPPRAYGMYTCGQCMSGFHQQPDHGSLPGFYFINHPSADPGLGPHAFSETTRIPENSLALETDFLSASITPAFLNALFRYFVYL